MWTPFRELQSFVENSIAKPEECPQDFERILSNHRQNFLTLLKNPVIFCVDCNTSEFTFKIYLYLQSFHFVVTATKQRT